MSNQQAMLPDKNCSNRLKQVPFALLLPVILPQLDKDRATELQTLYAIPKNEMRGIVGDHMLKLAVTKIQQPGSYQFHMQREASAPQSHPRMQPPTPAKFNESQSFPRLHEKGSKAPHSVSSSGQDRDHTSAPAPAIANRQPASPVYGSGDRYHTFSETHPTSNASSGISISRFSNETSSQSSIHGFKSSRRQG